MTLLNHCTLVVHPDFSDLAPFVRSLPERFARGEGEVIHQGRNELRLMQAGTHRVVVKSFRRPNVVNRWVYGTLRPSKARRSYDNALLLRRLGIPTPAPVAYMTLRRGLAFDRSYYVSLASRCPHRYEELFTRQFACMDDVLDAIGRMTALLHENGLAHKDYGRANILFGQAPDGSIELDLVDLNRMHHGPLGIKAGCKNFERLPATPHMHRVMAEAYARARSFDPETCYRLITAYRSTQPGKIDGRY